MANSVTCQARFVSGAPVMTDYTPGSAVAVGDVVVVNTTPKIAHSAIPANTLGAMAEGGGVYECTCAAAIADGKVLWWDDTNNRVTETATSNAHFGRSVGASYSSDTKVKVLHQPQGVTGAIV